MSSSSDFELIHGQLHVTHGNDYGSVNVPSTPESLGRHVNQIRGAAYIQGPVQFGDDKAFQPDVPPPFTAPVPIPEGVLMVGPLKNTDSPLPFVCEPLDFCGEPLLNPYSLVVRSGDHTTKEVVCGVGPTSIGIAATIVTPSTGAGLFIGDLDVYGGTRVKNNLVADEEVMSNCGAHVLSAKKNFDIPHPSKEGWRLTYACVEGPEAAVFFRGRVRNKTEISLPNYWKDFVDINSITVNLTPVGSHQDVIIKRWDENKIYLQSKGGMPIDCFYHIYAERKDTERLIAEYEGTIEDYPGDNSQRSIAGYHYDNKENN